MSGYIALSYWQLAAASVFVLVDAGLSVAFGPRVHCSLLFAAVRMVVQLALVGLVLTTLFSVVSPLWTGLAALGMVLFGGHEAAQRQERRLSGWWSYGVRTVCMMIASVVMFLIAGGTGLGAVTAGLGGVYHLTDTRHRLRLDRLTAPKPA